MMELETNKLNPLSKNYTFRGLITGSLVLAVAFSYMFHISFSNVCLRAKSVGQSSEDFLYAIRYRRYMKDLLLPNVKRLDAFVGTVFVYDANLDRRATVVSTTSNTEGEEVSAAFVRLDNDPVYLDQLDNHKNGDCFFADISRIKNGIYKSQAEQSRIRFRFSCPIRTAENTLFGYVSYGYIGSVRDLSTKVEEARSSALMKVLAQ